MMFQKALMTLGAVAALAVSGSSSLFGSPSGIVDVPFSFKYMSAEMPAGRYAFRYSISPSAVLLTSLKKQTTIQVRVQDGRTMQPIHMIFEEKDGTYTLKEVK